VTSRLRGFRSVMSHTLPHRAWSRHAPRFVTGRPSPRLPPARCGVGSTVVKGNG
jgi:hypothetical protein